MKTTLLATNGTAVTVEYTQRGNNDYETQINGQATRIQLLSEEDGAVTLLVNGQPLRVHVVHDGQRSLAAIDGHVYEFSRAGEKKGTGRQRETGRLSPEIRSPMPGKILAVRVSAGDTVEAGQVLVLLEAMKMENALTAEGIGQVKKIHVSVGDLVELGQLLVELEFATAHQDGSEEVEKRGNGEK
ncbi:MAG: acetyl-CoA carboxylase biotin carboxyl carrier protein subunit [Deltaproteobacteria bacterium]|nr:acetyl-CoA carboxylase biotin carboxyl carrier protein subunit [Deltaproteobacteria bacterium]